jgi:hypothetical protein
MVYFKITWRVKERAKKMKRGSFMLIYKRDTMWGCSIIHNWIRLGCRAGVEVWGRHKKLVTPKAIRKTANWIKLPWPCHFCFAYVRFGLSAVRDITAVTDQCAGRRHIVSWEWRSQGKSGKAAFAAQIINHLRPSGNYMNHLL